MSSTLRVPQCLGSVYQINHFLYAPLIKENSVEIVILIFRNLDAILLCLCILGGVNYVIDDYRLGGGASEMVLEKSKRTFRGEMCHVMDQNIVEKNKVPARDKSLLGPTGYYLILLITEILFIYWVGQKVCFFLYSDSSSACL